MQFANKLPAMAAGSAACSKETAESAMQMLWFADPGVENGKHLHAPENASLLRLRAWYTEGFKDVVLYDVQDEKPVALFRLRTNFLNLNALPCQFFFSTLRQFQLCSLQRACVYRRRAD